MGRVGFRFLNVLSKCSDQEARCGNKFGILNSEPTLGISMNFQSPTESDFVSFAALGAIYPSSISMVAVFPQSIRKSIGPSALQPIAHHSLGDGPQAHAGDDTPLQSIRRCFRVLVEQFQGPRVGAVIDDSRVRRFGHEKGREPCLETMDTRDSQRRERGVAHGPVSDTLLVVAR